MRPHPVNRDSEGSIVYHNDQMRAPLNEGSSLVKINRMLASSSSAFFNKRKSSQKEGMRRTETVSNVTVDNVVAVEVNIKPRQHTIISTIDGATGQSHEKLYHSP